MDASAASRITIGYRKGASRDLILVALPSRLGAPRWWLGGLNGVSRTSELQRGILLFALPEIW